MVVPTTAFARLARSSAENRATIDFTHFGIFMRASWKNCDPSLQIHLYCLLSTIRNQCSVRVSVRLNASYRHYYDALLGRTIGRKCGMGGRFCDTELEASE